MQHQHVACSMQHVACSIYRAGGSSAELVGPTPWGVRGRLPGKFLELSSNSLILGTFWHEIGLVIIMRSAMNYGN